jgi:murein DD-endopeptidase MepM/ murein hydrolase activator NlpD
VRSRSRRLTGPLRRHVARVRQPRSLRKARWWARSGGGANPLLDLSPLLVSGILLGVLVPQVVAAWTGPPTRAVDAASTALFDAVVWSVGFAVAMSGWATRWIVWAAALLAWIPAAGAAAAEPHRLDSSSVIGAGAAAVLTLALVIAQRVAGRRCRRLTICSPFLTGHYSVAQGGLRLTNQHARDRRQRFALDIVRVRAFGPRVRRALPRELDDYLTYGAALVSPVEGTVVSTLDGVDDQTGLRWPPQGNHVVIEPAGHPGWRILLCHLRAGSVRVVPGQHLEVGTPLGQVGSSGNSSEPHLHLQINDDRGEAVGICIGRRRPLVRNDRIRGQADQSGLAGARRRTRRPGGPGCPAG